jgi:hypothetical protein
VILLTILSAPSLARADGGLIIEESYSETTGETQTSAALEGLVNSSGQRAVIWLSDDGCWDLIVDPGTITVEGAAWVLPLPVNPTVYEASPEFIDELDAATSPLLITRRRTEVTYYEISSSDDGGGFGCSRVPGDAEYGDIGNEIGSETTDEREEVEPVEPSVRVWQQGRLGAVDYEVVTSEDATQLESWLVANGYVVPEDLDEHMSVYVEEGAYFFVARLINDEEGQQANLPVFRFTLCGADQPSYPMRLSRLSVASELAFTLWVVSPPSGNRYQVENATVGTFDYFWEDYDSAFDIYYPDEIPEFEELYSIRRAQLHDLPRGLAVEMDTSLTTAQIEQRIDVLGSSMADFPLSADSNSWTNELSEIAESGRRVVRLSGSFTMEDMESDILLSEGAIIEDTGVYTRTITEFRSEWVYGGGSSSDEDDVSGELFGDASSSCVVTGRERSRRDGITIPLVFLGLVVLALVRRRSRK